MRLEIDHVILAVRDLGSAARGLEQVLGLRAIPGGRHPALGTENALVPIGGAYLELVAVADETLAATSAFGRAALLARTDGPRFTGWVARTPDLDAAAQEWNSPLVEMSRETPEGGQVSWRMTGVERLGDGGVLPPLITWDDEATAPPFAHAVHPAGKVTLDCLEINDPDRELSALPAVARLRVEHEGQPGVRAVVLIADGRELVVTPAVVH